MLLKKNFTFIDLFAGIGGFHCAMNNYSGGRAKCLMASEINVSAQKMYSNYFKMPVLGDIKNIKQEDIGGVPDVVCGGFPCQTFSKAGMQQGFGDPRGTLFREIVRLIENDDIQKQPKLLILENVGNLITHDKGVTWNTIKKALTDVNYNVIDTPIIVSPKDFDIPQLRERAIILAVRKDIYNGDIDIKITRKKTNTLDIYTVVKDLPKGITKQYRISKHEEDVLKCWDEFIKGIKFIPTWDLDRTTPVKHYERKEFKGIIGFPIWAFEFGKDVELIGDEVNYPQWKQEFILKNRSLYVYNKVFIDKWLKKWNYLEGFSHTDKKMEWQCGTYKSIWDGIIQFRPSGIRVKKPTESPTLVAMVHIPIIGKFKRYITIEEAAQLQSFPADYDFTNESKFSAYMQLGNAVNVKVIENIFKIFIDFLNKNTK